MKTESVFARLRRSQAAAYERAPAIREIFDRAGLKPADLKTTDDLARLSVFKKEALLAQQRENPPFGGFLAAREEDIARIFVSPGPINEPQFKGESDGHGFARVFSAANVGPGDLALNTWSYHLVPAGLLVDEGLRAAGSAVIPAGVGGSELQAKLVMELGVTCICASTAFFVTLAETIEGLGYALPESWKVKSALLGGELGDWLGKRRRLEAAHERQRPDTGAGKSTRAVSRRHHQHRRPSPSDEGHAGTARTHVERYEEGRLKAWASREPHQSGFKRKGDPKGSPSHFRLTRSVQPRIAGCGAPEETHGRCDDARPIRWPWI